MKKSSKFASRVQKFSLQSANLWMGLLISNAYIAFGGLPSTMKLGLALASWVLMAACGAMSVALWQLRKG